MTVLLDTQAFLHAYFAVPMPKKVEALLGNVAVDRFLSTTSLIEISIKNGLGKLAMTEHQARKAADDLALTILPFTPVHAYCLFSLPWHHRDPFDRMIIATALTENLPLASGDREFKQYVGLELIW